MTPHIIHGVGVSPKEKVVGVLGPTASGKSDLAVALALQLNGEIVNVDSVQVYRDFNVGSAKLPVQDRRGIPHHCIDIFSPSEPSNVSQFRDEALQAVKAITEKKKLPILAGGSGMYLTVLLHGLADLPEVPAELRARIQEMSDEEMHQKLTQVDSAAASRLHVHDRQRVSRALEVCELTGRPQSDLFSEHNFSDAPVVGLLIVLCHPREVLYERINTRSVRIIENGLIAETRHLIEKYGEIPLLNTIGYAQAQQYLAGALTESTLPEQIALHTRRYAKRQMTYLRNEPKKRGWDTYPAEGEGVTLDSAPQSPSKRMKIQEKSFNVLRLSEEALFDAVKTRLLQPLDRSEVWYVHLNLHTAGNSQ